MRITDKYVFFYGGIYSNWYPCEFTWRGISFNCSEQAMMWAKAMVFGDSESAKKIMETEFPSEQKKLGRKVKGFDPNAWEQVCVDIVTHICYCKFSQNEYLKLEMLKDGMGRNFVESSPYDKIWGIGLDTYDDKVLDENNWNGKNYLGICLDNVYQKLKEENLP
ncbi:MAG: NADAR family protein [Bacteroidales bacterium]|jgi:ribA/ribD-fused uncharacterized protein|nr:NADAR family protein [Bacteroidales bacterium]